MKTFIPTPAQPEYGEHVQRFLRHAGFVMLLEGGGAHTQRPTDPGGETWWGVSRRYHEAAFNPGPVTLGTSVDLMWVWWIGFAGHLLPQPVDLVTLDHAFNGGYGKAVAALQRALGVVVDGVVGPQTLKAALAHDPKRTAEVMLADRSAQILERDHPEEHGLLERIKLLRWEAGLGRPRQAGAEGKT